MAECNKCGKGRTHDIHDPAVYSYAHKFEPKHTCASILLPEACAKARRECEACQLDDSPSDSCILTDGTFSNIIDNKKRKLV